MNLENASREIEIINKKLKRIINGLNYIAEIIFIDQKEFDDFKKECRKLTCKTKQVELDDNEKLCEFYYEEYDHEYGD